MICPRCKHEMHKAGSGWSGRTKYQKYRCWKCGATKLNTKEPYVK